MARSVELTEDGRAIFHDLMFAALMRLRGHKVKVVGSNTFEASEVEFSPLWYGQAGEIVSYEAFCNAVELLVAETLGID